MDKPYDIIVIGCGSGGLSVGLFMAKAGFRTLMIDRTDRAIGGDCLNDGCVPSKALLHAARILQAARAAGRFGLKLQGAPDLGAVMEYVHSRQEIIRPHENKAALEAAGAEVALGAARFTGPNEVEVEGKRYRGRRIVIATGSSPRKLQVPGVEAVRYYDNRSLFDIRDLPQRLLVAGGGPIGIEMAQAFRRLGSEVTVVQRGSHILPHDDAAVTSVLQQQLEEEGIRFRLSAEVTGFPSSGEAEIQTADGRTERLPMDAVLAATGRVLEWEGLELHRAGIETKGGTIVTRGYLQTTNKAVFLCGDIAGTLQFSHAAEYMARNLLNNFFSPFTKKTNPKRLSWVTFTDPEVATFGLSEEALKKKGLRYRRLETSFEGDDRAVTDGHRYGRLVLFISQGGPLHREKLLGGSMVAPGAGELVQELILAVSERLPLSAVFNKIYPYPVAARINQKAIVEYKSEGLTPFVKRALGWAYKIFG